MYQIEVGKTYSPDLKLPLPEKTQFNAIIKGTYRLEIFTKGATKQKLIDILKGEPEFDLGIEEDIIYFLYKFGSCAWSDAPFSSWMLKQEWRKTPPHLPEGLGILLEVIVIDSITGIVRGLRTVSLTVEYSQRLRQAIVEQLASPEISRQEYNRRVDRFYLKYPTSGAYIRSLYPECQIDISKMSDREIENILIEMGMQQNIISIFSRHFDKKLTYEPKGYFSSAAISRFLLSNMATVDTRVASNIPVRAKLSVMSALANSPLVPWYYLGDDLTWDLSRTEVPQEIPQFITLPPCGIIILPIHVRVSTGQIPFIAYQIIPKGSNTSYPVIKDGEVQNLQIDTTKTEGDTLAWFAPDTGGFLYGGMNDLIPNANSYRVDNNVEEFTENPILETKETSMLLSILLGALTYADPQTITEDAKGFGSKIKKTKKGKTIAFSAPLFIGKERVSVLRNYQPAAQKTSASNKRKSPSPHWRRGFWKGVRTGKGRVKKKWVLIAPTIVGLK